jgi:SAM-dependent methyltransferase
MKILVIGSNRVIEKKGFAQHTPEQDFGKDIETVYMDLFGADVLRDINDLPYPFKKNEFDGIFLSHVLEHADPQKILKILNEIHRITKPNKKIVIYVPHFSSSTALPHLTHYKSFGIHSFDTVCDNIPIWEKYIRGKFNLENKKLVFPKRFFLLNHLPVGAYTYWENWFKNAFSAHEIKFVLISKK